MLLVERVSLLHYLIDGSRVAVFSYVLTHVPFLVPVEVASVVEEVSVLEEISVVEEIFVVEEDSVQVGDTLVSENDVPEEVQSVQ